ncbi:MAG: hypothetical protein Q9196_000866 [Gyalolechia fulgens]
MDVPPSPPVAPTDPCTPTSSSRSNRAPIKIDPTRPSWARERMAGHGLIFDDRNAPIRCPELRDKIEELLGWDLSPPPNEHSVRTYKYRKDEYRTDNERTRIRQMMPLLVKDAHRVLLPGHKDQSEPKDFTVETWESHGLKVITETDFHRMQGSKDIKIHMTRVRTVALDDDDALGTIRRHLHNIIHWGLIHRLPDLEAFHKKLRAVEPTFWKELQERAKKEQNEKASKKRKK